MCHSRILVATTLFAAAALCGANLVAGPGSPAARRAGGDASAPTAADARKFLDDAQQKLLALSVAGQRANWVHQTYITEDTERLAADANRDLTAAIVDLALDSPQRVDGVPSTA